MSLDLDARCAAAAGKLAAENETINVVRRQLRHADLCPLEPDETNHIRAMIDATSGLDRDEALEHPTYQAMLNCRPCLITFGLMTELREARRRRTKALQSLAMLGRQVLERETGHG